MLYRNSVSTLEIPHAKRGRPRSEAAKTAILDAAYELVADHGMANVTVDRIAAQASVGKQTIYRWWQSKAEVVLDALAERVPIEEELLNADSVEAFLTGVVRGANRVGLVLRSLLAAAQSDESVKQALAARLLGPREAAFVRCLERAGVPRSRWEGLTIAVFGAVWYRLLSNEPLDDVFVEKLSRLAE